ncbi:hypothetical protein CHI06_06215 [Bacillus sp. 7884-1]|nr:hypothetical protein CHI06_06215 [Bacillus sp. 7884-1]
METDFHKKMFQIILDGYIKRAEQNTTKGAKKAMKKSLLVSGLAVSLTFAGLTGCGDGVDQDNGVSDGQQDDAVDTETKQKADDTINNVKTELKQAQKDLEKKIDDNGVSDGVNQ